MRPFAYKAPTSVGQAVALLETAGQSARPLAGGTDFLVQLRHRLIELDVVVDLKVRLLPHSLDPPDDVPGKTFTFKFFRYYRIYSYNKFTRFHDRIVVTFKNFPIRIYFNFFHVKFLFHKWRYIIQFYS